MKPSGESIANGFIFWEKAMSFEEKEQLVKAFIDQDEKDSAVKLLFEMVVDCAKSGRFLQAEACREQIMAVNSMALTEIIKSAEIIESEKAKVIDLGHKKIWKALYDKLTEEEANAFYFSLKKISLKSGKMIMQQGRVNNRLFLIDAGTLQVNHEQGRSQVYLKDVAKGEPIGLRTFLNISYATINVITKESVSLHYLERPAFESLLEKFPGFDGKLEPLCADLVKEKIEDILKTKSMERRQYKRFNTSGKVAAYILNSNGQPSKTPIYGVLGDVSQGGLVLPSASQKKRQPANF